MRKIILLAGLLIPTLRSAPSQDPQFISEWNAFARPMSAYVAGLNGGVVQADKLREAMRAWRKLERDQGWGRVR